MEYTETIYDKRGRVAMSRSGNLRAENKWAFTKYDEFDRPVMTGIVSGGTYGTRKAVYDTLSVFGESYSTTAGNIHKYTNRCYPTSISESDILTISYYDNYDWQLVSDYAFNSAKSLSQSMSNDIVGLVTGTKTKVLGIDHDQWLTSVVYYDEKYRTIQTIAGLYPDGTETVAIFIIRWGRSHGQESSRSSITIFTVTTNGSTTTTTVACLISNRKYPAIRTAK